MVRIFHRASFTIRLAAIAVAVLVALVVVDYLALLEVPRRIARDTVEIALRENVQSLNATFREDRAQLKEHVDDLVNSRTARVALLDGDSDTVSQQLAAYDPDIRYEVRDPVDHSIVTGAGPISYSIRIQGRDRAAQVTFYKPVDNGVLERASDATGNEAPFALERDGRFIATSDTFPKSIDPDQVGGPVDRDLARLQDLTVDGMDLHVYSRSLTSDPSYQLHALSTNALEKDALSEIDRDVRAAIGAMTIATVLAFLLLIFFTNRTVRAFAGRVRSLADGDYGTRMRVRGNDGFAMLASSVNRLSEQLALQVGQLEDTAQAFGRTLETLDEGICVWDDEGNVQYWNRGAEQLTGLARERVDVRDPVIQFLRAEQLPGTRRVTLPVGRGRGGLVVDLVVTAMPGGGILQTFRDTTMADLLQQTQRNFMATAAHELRTPITTILGFSDTLVNPELELTERQRTEFISIIRDHAYQLQQISDAFFTNHQLANERVEVSIVPARVDALVEDALRRVKVALPERADELEHVIVDIPDETLVLADRRALIGVVAVLVENALKYGEPPIAIGTERVGGTVTISVSDQGPGIDATHHARVFDPFYRVDVDMRSGVGGAGLGLFTARKLVEAMHGTIRVLSAPGAGATFVVELPVGPLEFGEGDDDRDGADGPPGLRLVG